MIVPPTWNKTEYHNTLSNVWKRAARELSDAEHIFIIGYSLPESDYFFKFLYSLGTIGSNTIKGFHVINPDKSVVPNYERMISSFTASKLNFIPLVLGGSLGELQKEIGKIISLG